ncbi:MAG: riboflavin synthase [Promethearchaeota archaeon]
MAKRVGIVDTTFARFDMGSLAVQTIRENANLQVIRRTVPGVKDLPVASKKLVEEEQCSAVLVIGMPGPEPIDKTCAHEASLGIIRAQLMTNTHILECFVHEDEASTDTELIEICKDRASKHALNLIRVVEDPDWFVRHAGQGLRQGHPDAGPLE